MLLTSVFASSVLLFAVYLERGCDAIQCYQCYGRQCELQAQNKTTCHDLARACFEGHGMLNGVKIFGRGCAPAIGPSCVAQTCSFIPLVIPQLQGLSNCTGTCCADNLCNNGTVTASTKPPTMPTTTPMTGVKTEQNTTSNTTEASTALTPTKTEASTAQTPTTAEGSTAHTPSGKASLLITVLFFALLIV